MAAAILELMATPRGAETRGDTIFGGRRGRQNWRKGWRFTESHHPGAEVSFLKDFITC